MLADETEQTVDELLAAIRKPPNAVRPEAVRNSTRSAGEVLGSTFARDQGEFFPLILELADFAATCIAVRAARYRTRVTETLAGLEEMLKEFVAA
ncbi:hypothetical protein [Streptomyces sp. NPDC001604]|uniref:hypothetical protein n=1 Tax=Streptomyces sp. NPDC001604 TaxID=3364593 RepID=UPI0036BCB78E